jgi:predicted dehydrogenase
MNESRRSFLKRAGTAAVVYKVVSSGRPAELKAAGPNDQIGLGFIGVGIRGSILLDGFKTIPGVRIVAAADAYDGFLQRTREQTSPAAETTKDYRAILDRKDIDAVVIATPDHWHKKMVLDALAAGKHVYAEKPLTWSIDEGKEIIAAEKKSGKLVQVGSGVKTAATTAKAREIVKSGVLGKVNMVRIENNRNNPEGAWLYPIPPDASPKTIDWNSFLGSSPKRPFDAKVFFRWRCWWEYSGGVATDLFVHMITGLHEFMDVPAPVSVVSQGGIYRWDDGRTVPDVMNSVFEYAPGFLADIYVNLGSSKFAMNGTVVKGSQATLLIEGRRLTVYPEPNFPEAQRYATGCWPAEMRKQYFAQFKDPEPSKKPEEVPVTGGPSHHELFIMALRNGTKSPENATEGHCAAGAAHLANMAYRRGRRMKWDWKTGKVTEA